MVYHGLPIKDGDVHSSMSHDSMALDGSYVQQNMLWIFREHMRRGGSVALASIDLEKNAGANPPEKRWKYIIKQTRMWYVVYRKRVCMSMLVSVNVVVYVAVAGFPLKSLDFSILFWNPFAKFLSCFLQHCRTYPRCKAKQHLPNLVMTKSLPWKMMALIDIDGPYRS